MAVEIWLDFSHEEEERIKNYMRDNLYDAIENGEINITTLAEDACNAIHKYLVIPENYFELALEVSDEPR